MSLNELKAPPALAATTIMQANAYEHKTIALTSVFFTVSPAAIGHLCGLLRFTYNYLHLSAGHVNDRQRRHGL